MHRDRPKMIRAVLAASLVLAAPLSAPTPAVAHPHVWVSVESTVLVENGSIVGFRHRWTFDEFYTAMAIQGLDTNNDGIYSREELAELAQVNIDGLKEFSYFTFARLGDRQLALGAPKDYWLVHGPAPADSKPVASPPGAVAAVNAATKEPAAEPGVLSRAWSSLFGPSKPAASAKPEPAKVLALEFTAPLEQPVLVEAPEFGVSIHDPSWFIAFELAEGEPVKLSGAPEGCRIDLGEAAKPGADEVARIGDAFSGQFGGAGTVRMSGTKLIKLNCGPKS